MAHWFDDLTKSIVDDTNGTISRRRAVRNIAGVIAGMTLASWFPGQALAQTEYTHTCKVPGTCSTSFFNCYLNRYHNTNCYCFQQMGAGRGVCGCNSYCACDSGSIPPCICNSQSDCGSGYFCITNTGCGCTIGYCVPKCSSTCTLSPNHSGRTVAGV
ncbi:MAG: hypothetical protein ACYDER_26505 [Ktedonobacteraceae bacterium]